jgi:hypothetical protein
VRPRPVTRLECGGARGMVVHRTTASASGLRALDFQSLMLSLGAVLGVGKKCPFVIIPMLPGRYSWVTVDHRIISSGSVFLSVATAAKQSPVCLPRRKLPGHLRHRRYGLLTFIVGNLALVAKIVVDPEALAKVQASE